jgi:hypothetical protein
VFVQGFSIESKTFRISSSSTLLQDLEAPYKSCNEAYSHQKAIYKLEREEEDLRLEINHLEGSTLSWRGRKTPAEGKP